MRYFIAVNVPEGLQHPDVPGVRNVASHHITLKFLGDVDHDTFQRLKKRLLCVRFHAFQARTTGYGSFPNRRRPNILWLGVESQELLALQQRIDSVLKDDFAPERNYVPHITLARAKSKQGRDAIRRFVEQTHHESFSWRVGSFSLYSSKLTQAGPEYREEKRYS
jgi:2'-5' RNA ligase